MHRLIKIRIIRDFEHLEERWRCRPDICFESNRTAVHFRPAADFYETTQGLVLRLELAGVKPEQLSLSLAGQELVVTGRRQPPPPEGIRRFIHLEMGFGAFERSFILPIPIDPQGVQARFLDGILEITLPRKAPRGAADSGEAGRPGINPYGELMATEEQNIQAPLLGDQEIHPSPRVLSILPTPDLVLFPRLIMPLVLWEESAQKLVQEALFQDKIFGILASRKDKVEGHNAEDLYQVGTAAAILKMRKSDDDSVRLLVQGLYRFRVEEWVGFEPYFAARINPISEEYEPDLEVEALVSNVKGLFLKMMELSPYLPAELGTPGAGIERPPHPGRYHRRQPQYLQGRKAGTAGDPGRQRAPAPGHEPGQPGDRDPGIGQKDPVRGEDRDGQGPKGVLPPGTHQGPAKGIGGRRRKAAGNGKGGRSRSWNYAWKRPTCRPTP